VVFGSPRLFSKATSSRVHRHLPSRRVLLVVF
jgi:hypothetical protein